MLHSEIYSVMVVYANLQIDFPLTALRWFVKLYGLKFKKKKTQDKLLLQSPAMQKQGQQGLGKRCNKWFHPNVPLLYSETLGGEF